MFIALVMKEPASSVRSGICLEVAPPGLEKYSARITINRSPLRG